MMRKVSLLFSVLVLIGFLSVSGCGDGNGGGSSLTPCSGTALCVGVLTVDESLESSFTQGLVPVAEKAVQDITGAGGSMELRTVEMGDCNEYGTPSKGAERLIGAGVHAIVGHICSGVSNHILDNVSGSKDIIMISPTNTSTIFSSGEDKYKHYFRTSPSDVAQAGVLAEILDTNLSSTYVIYRNDDYGKTFYEELERNGVATATDDAMSYVLPNDPATGDYSAIVDFLSGKGNDQTGANIILIAFGEGEYILKTLLSSEKIHDSNKYYFTDAMYGLLYELKDELDSLGTDDLVDDTMQDRNPDREKLAELFHTNSAGFYTTFVAEYAYSPREKGAGMPPVHPLTEAQDMFRADYPHPFNSHTYDAVILLALASHKAGSTNPADLAGELVNVTRKTGLEGTCISYGECTASDYGNDIDYDGLSGPIEFDGNGDVTKSAYGIFSYEGRETNEGEVRNATIP